MCYHDGTCTEMVLFFPNTLCKKNDDRIVSIQSPISRRLVADSHRLLWTSRRPIADPSPTDRRLNAKRSPNARRLVGDWSETGQRPYQKLENSNQSPRGRAAVASSVGPGLRTILYSFKLIIHYSLLIFALIKLLFFIFRTSLFSDHFILLLIL